MPRSTCPYCGQDRRRLAPEKHDAQTRLDLLEELEQLIQTKGYMGMITAMRRIRDRESLAQLSRKTPHASTTDR